MRGAFKIDGFENRRNLIAILDALKRSRGLSVGINSTVCRLKEWIIH
jgi:hypothetical protein